MKPYTQTTTDRFVAEHERVREINVWNVLGGYGEYLLYNTEDMEAVDLLDDALVIRLRPRIQPDTLADDTF